MTPSEQRTVIALSGADGAGKSTFGKRLEETLRKVSPEVTVNRLWLRWNPRVQSSRQHDTSTVTASHRGHPAKRAAKRLGLANVWVEAAVRSYRRQLALQLESSPPGSVVIADRFTMDFVADLVAASVISEDRAPDIVGQLPQASRAFVVDAADAVLVSRCKPGDDPRLVVARAALYRRLAAALDLDVVSSEACDVDEVVSLLRPMVRS